MNRLIALSLSVLWMGAAGVHADHHEGHGWKEKRMEKKQEKLTKELNLNPQQQEQLKGILQAEQDQMKSLHEQMLKIHQETSGKIEGILTTDEQKKKYAEWKAKKMDKMKEHHDNMQKK